MMIKVVMASFFNFTGLSIEKNACFVLFCESGVSNKIAHQRAKPANPDDSRGRKYG